MRTRRDMPLEYANTAANKAMCQWGLPDDPADPAATNAGNLLRARTLLGGGPRDLHLVRRNRTRGGGAADALGAAVGDRGVRPRLLRGATAWTHPGLGQMLLAAAIALVASVAGGVLGGLKVGREALGTELAAMMGAFFGPIAGFAGALVGLLALLLLARL